MSVDLVRCPRFAPLAALVLVIFDQFLLLRVHGNDGLAGPQSPFDGAVDMPELRVTIGMIVPPPRSCGCLAGCSHPSAEVG
jgi:hypothetical protein